MLTKKELTLAQLTAFLNRKISVAIITYCLVAIVHHDMQLKRSTYEVLQILSISLTVVGYYGGSLDSLLRTDALVSKVVRNLDGEVVANNFEWKANTAPFGKVYFNL